MDSPPASKEKYSKTMETNRRSPDSTEPFPNSTVVDYREKSMGLSLDEWICTKIHKETLMRDQLRHKD